MKILYGVVGEGMGHATRSRVILEHLLSAGHHVHVVVSGRAHKFLGEKFRERPRIDIVEIAGLNLAFEGNDLDVPESVRLNLAGAPAGLLKNLEVVQGAVASFAPELVISDFESIAYLFGRSRGIPVVSIDNMQVLNRCRHDDFVTDDESFSFRLAKLAVKAKLPGAYHYLVSSFFPPVRKPRTTLVPPILRKEILEAERDPRDHVLVYQTAASNLDLVPTLQSLPGAFRVYGMGRAGVEKNVTLCAFSETGFVDDLRTARAVIAGGGYSLMGEVVHVGVPMLSVPIGGQFEQELNARYLQKLGYGRHASALTRTESWKFFEDTAQMERSLARYPRHDNAMLFQCIDELVRHVWLDEPAPNALASPNLGAWEGPALSSTLRDALE